MQHIFSDENIRTLTFFQTKILPLRKDKKMKRFIYDDLVKWSKKADNNRKPLLIEGARQVGKTWLARELGNNEFESYIELNFEKQKALRTLFELDFDIQRIMLAISAFSGKTVTPGKTLIFFDEIQWAPRGLLCLKYFKDEHPEYHIIAAGSLLGVIDHEGDSFPVGKVEYLNVYPMNFAEFLLASGKEKFYDILKSNDWSLINVMFDQFENSLRNYYYVGGMPEAVQTFVDSGDYASVRKVQRDLIKSYKKDFSKHPPKDVVPRMHLVWDSIPGHLSKENKKLVYSAIRPGARAKDFETAIQWLVDAGVVYRQTRVTAGESPLKGFEDEETFKLFLVDIGLLGAMCGLNRKSLIDGSEFYKQYKGAMTEQFVMQELMACGAPDLKVHYWAPDVGEAELDFVIETGGYVAPLEAKAEQNLKAKSLKSFSQKYKTPYIFRTSISPYFKGDNVTDIPLFAVTKTVSLLNQD